MRNFLKTAMAIYLLTLTPSAQASNTLIDLATEKAVSVGAEKKPMVLIFWASWCKNCSENLNAAQKLFSPEILKEHVRGVSVDDDIKSAKTYFAKKPHVAYFKDYSFLDKGGSYAEAIKLDGLPGVVLMDASGQVVQRWQGVMDAGQQNDLKNRLMTMVKKP